MALKQVYNSEMVQRELSILSNLPHQPNLVKCHEIVDISEFEKCIVMEKGDYDLEQFIESQEYPLN